MPPSLAKALAHIGSEAAEVFIEHLRARTSANYLSDWLERAGAPVSATTLKEARRAIA